MVSNHTLRRVGDPYDVDYTSMRRMPLIFRMWFLVINSVAAPLLFASVLIAQDGGYIASRSRDTVEALRQHTVQTSSEASAKVAADLALAKALADVRETLDRNNRVVRVICADRGRDPDVRNACLWGTGAP